MDNAIFNVNGEDKELLKLTLQLLFKQDQSDHQIQAWSVNPCKGLILYDYHQGDSIGFPVPLSYNMVTELVWEWLQSEQAKKIIDNEYSTDFDGSISRGWRVYIEDSSPYGVLGIVTPSYLYYSK